MLSLAPASGCAPCCGSRSETMAVTETGIESSRGVEIQLPLAEARQRIIEAFERRYVDHILAAHRGNVTKAARAAGVSTRYFQLLIAKLKGVERPSRRRDRSP